MNDDQTIGPRALDSFGRAELAVLAREYMLCGHLIDRAAMGYLIGPYGLEGMRDIAVDEWMGASPVYTARMQHLLGFRGDDVATIFKGMQLDIGAPHEFLDFRYAVHDSTHGEFHLEHCGALMDVEPMGEEFVVAMCHDIEDPTFDATACASNPRARVRPVHRPPRQPADRVPHCAWTVEIPADAEPLREAGITREMRATVAASLPLPSIVGFGGRDGEGRDHYSDDLVDHIQFEEFSKGALLAIIDELCLQQHLLSMSFMLAVERRAGTENAVELGDHQFTGIAGITSERFRRALGLGTDLAAVAVVLGLHPALRPRSYVDARLVHDGRDLTLSLHDCPAFDEVGVESWVGLLADGHDRGLDAAVHAVNPAARCVPVPPIDGARLSWRVALEDAPLDEEPEVGVTRMSTGAAFRFEAPGEVPVWIVSDQIGSAR